MRKLMKPLLLSVGLFVCPAIAICQQPVPATLSLADAIALAREHNPAYRQTIHDRSPAAWGVRNAWSSLWLPSVTASGGVGYAGPGEQNFLTSSFSQSVSTWSSSYSLLLDWTLNGQTLSQPGLKKAQLNAAQADVVGAETDLVTAVTQQYLTVLQARDNAEVARQQLDHDEQFLKLAQARYDVGRASLIDVRQAQVARGAAEVSLLRARTVVQVEKLRLFQQIGVSAPVDLRAGQLTDTLSVQTPDWPVPHPLRVAEQQNPSLKALRERERAAGWGVKAASSSWGPSVALSAGWSGFTQKLSDITPTIAGARASAAADSATGAYANSSWFATRSGQPLLDSTQYAFNPATEQSPRHQNGRYPFHFTPQPFQARLTVTIPLWGNFHQPLLVSQAKAQQQDLQESVRARGLQVQTDVSQAYLTLETAFQTIAIQYTNRTAAREQLHLATERYRVGSGTVFELLDAQVAGLRAETDHIKAQFDYH